LYATRNLIFPTLNTSKSCFVNKKMVCMLPLFMFQPAKPKWYMRILNHFLPVTHLNYRIFRPIARALSIQKRSEIVKNEHARYTLERFSIDNARVICTKKVSENTVLCIKHNFQLKLVCSIHYVALLNITLFKSKKFFIGLYIERINRV
jgi:hypothetical protein